jgi:hypothetical protein
MANNTNRHIVPNPNGGWDVQAPGGKRASAHTATQAEAIDRGRGIIRNAGGGELNIHNRAGQIRSKDSVPKGNDPRNVAG